MKDALALALVRAELCRACATEMPRQPAAKAGTALVRVLTRTLRPFRRKQAFAGIRTSGDKIAG